jgi:hypothetical protein
MKYNIATRPPPKEYNYPYDEDDYDQDSQPPEY